VRSGSSTRSDARPPRGQESRIASCIGAIEPVHRHTARVRRRLATASSVVSDRCHQSPVTRPSSGRAHQRRHLARAQLARNLLPRVRRLASLRNVDPSSGRVRRCSGVRCGRSCSICRGRPGRDVGTGARRTSDEPVAGGRGLAPAARPLRVPTRTNPTGCPCQTPKSEQNRQESQSTNAAGRLSLAAF